LFLLLLLQLVDDASLGSHRSHRDDPLPPRPPFPRQDLPDLPASSSPLHPSPLPNRHPHLLDAPRPLLRPNSHSQPLPFPRSRTSHSQKSRFRLDPSPYPRPTRTKARNPFGLQFPPQTPLPPFPTPPTRLFPSLLLRKPPSISKDLQGHQPEEALSPLMDRWRARRRLRSSALSRRVGLESSRGVDVLGVPPLSEVEYRFLGWKVDQVYSVQERQEGGFAHL